MDQAFCSFTGDTGVLMADGARKPIKDIEPGDEVLAGDPETGARSSREVTALAIHQDTVLDLVVEDGSRITTTEDHPFWNATDGIWERADQLDPGDALLASDGGLVRVVGLDPASTRTATAHNLSVAAVPTYYVLVGRTPVLVHNTDSCRVIGSVDNLLSNLGDDVIFHYTDGKGYQAIIGSGTIRADAKGRAYMTQEMVASRETHNVLFAGNPAYAGKGGYVVAIRRPEGMSLRIGEQPNELIHQGSLRFDQSNVLYAGPNPFG